MLKKLSKLLLVLLLLVAGLVVFAAFFLDGLINQQKDKYLPEVTKLLGRDVGAGDVATRLLPILGAELRDLKIAGAPGEGAALLSIDRVVFSFELWAALRSAGRDARLKELVIDGLTLNVERNADGSFSFDDILARLDSGPPPEEAPTPLSPEAKQFIQNLQLERIALENTRVRFIDRATGGEPATIEIQDLLIESREVALTSPLTVVVKAALLGAQRNFELKTRLGPLPLGAEGDEPLKLHSIALSLEELDLAPILPYLGEALPVSLQSAQVAGHISVEEPLGVHPRVEGDLRVAGLRFEDGEAFSLRVAPKVRQDRAGGRIELEAFVLEIDDMALRAQGTVSGLLSGGLSAEGVKVESQGLDFTRLMARLPPLRAALPKGSVLEGPFKIAAQLEGDRAEQRVLVDTDFSTARIRVPGALDKPKGTALSLEADAVTTPKNLDLKKLRLRVGPLDFNAKGRVDNFDNPKVNLTGGTGSFHLDGLLRLLPAVRSAVPPDVKIAGTARLDVRAVGNAQSFDGHVVAQIDGADLAVPGATLQGSGKIDLTAKGSAQGALNALLDAHLTGLAIQAGDALNKRRGVPLEVKVDVGRSAAGALDVRSFRIAAGPTRVDGRGSLSANGRTADLQLKLAPFRLGELDQLVPTGLEPPLSQAQLGTQLSVKGDIIDLSKLEVKLSDFSFKGGNSDLRGDLSVANLNTPVIRFDLSGSNLDLDTLAPPGPDEPEADSGPIVIPEIVRQLDLEGRLRIAKGQARVLKFQNFEGDLSLKKGVLNVKRLGLKAFDGAVSAAGTRADLNPAQPALTLKFELDKIEMARLLSEVADQRKSLSGRASLSIDARGQGLDWAVLSQNLSGKVDLKLSKGRLERANLAYTLHSQLSKHLPFISKPTGDPGMNLRTLAGAFHIKQGMLKLDKPLVLDSPHGQFSFEGGVGLDTRLDLKGNVQLEPALLSQISGGKIKVKKPVPAAVRLGGTLEDPSFEGIEGAALAAALVAAAGLGNLDALRKQAEAEAARLKARAEAEAARLKARAEAEAARLKARAEAEAKRAQQKAEAAAKKAKQQAEAAAKQAEQRARAEADKAKQKAKQEADKAKKKAKDAVKGLF